MTNAARRKGDRAEREVVEELRHLGLPYVERSYGAGRPDDRGDLDGMPLVVAQVKDYADILRGIREGLYGADAQAMRHNVPWPVSINRWRGGLWSASMFLPAWVDMYRAACVDDVPRLGRTWGGRELEP